MEPRLSISGEKGDRAGICRKREGFISAFLVLALLALLLAAGSLLREQMALKMMSRGYERALKFDYHLEGFYLLIRTGSLIPGEGLSYGTMEGYMLEDTYDGKDYIEVLSDASQVRVRGYYGDGLRAEYRITK